MHACVQYIVYVRTSEMPMMPFAQSQLVAEEYYHLDGILPRSRQRCSHALYVCTCVRGLNKASKADARSEDLNQATHTILLLVSVQLC